MKFSARLGTERRAASDKAANRFAERETSGLTARQKGMLEYIGRTYAQLAATIEAMELEKSTWTSDPELTT